MPKKKYIPAEITKNDLVGYSLIFDDLGYVKKIFNKYDLTPTGHTWERAIEIYCADKKIDISQLDFDSESDLFAVYSENEEILQSIKSIINDFVTKPNILQLVLKKLKTEEDEEFSVLEFIEDLEYNEVDLSKPIELLFFIHFKNHSQAKEACELSTSKGYKCFLDIEDKESPFAATIEIVPQKNNIEREVSFFKRMANNLNGEFESCELFEDYEALFKGNVYGSEERWKIYE